MTTKHKITLTCLYILSGAITAKMGFGRDASFWLFAIPANLAAYFICEQIFKEKK
jgi:hypothetical protein